MHLSSVPDSSEEAEEVENEDEKPEAKEPLEEEDEKREDEVKEKEEVLHGVDENELSCFLESLPQLMLVLLPPSLRGFFSWCSSLRLRLEKVLVLWRVKLASSREEEYAEMSYAVEEWNISRGTFTFSSRLLLFEEGNGDFSIVDCVFGKGR